MLSAHGLGPLSLRAGTSEVALGGRLARRFAAVLVLRAEEVVSDDAMVEAVWGAQAPPRAEVSLQSYVSRLRVQLGVERDHLERVGDGYRLRLDDSDIRQFSRLAEDARSRLGDDPFRAMSQAQDALGWWRGEPFPELADADIVTVERARLLEMHQGTVEALIEARLHTGDATGAVPDAQRATQDAPFREHRWALLVLALYRSGRQAEAMTTLAQVKRLLADELGIDPGQELQELERQVFTADAALTSTVESGPLVFSPPAADRAPQRLPSPRSSFHGRHEELAELDVSLAEENIVTVVGPGGVGKTRLVLQWAASAREVGEVWFVPLADSRKPEDVAGSIARAVGLVGVSGHPIEDMIAALEGRPGVLIVDNCEHLTDPVARVVTELGSRLERLRVLATSREPLGIDAEVIVSLVPLPVRVNGGDGPALDLLVDRILVVRRGWQPTPGDLVQLRRLCATVDGLPLALELAAARARTMSITTIAEHLDGRFAGLAGVPVGSPATHADLSATIGWSIDSLNAEDSDLIQTLWPFEGGFDLELAIAANPTRDETGVLTSLASLVSKSLVFADPSGSSARYRMWETIRLYVREHDPSPREHREACARAIRGLVDAASQTFASPRSRYAMEQLEREIANIRFMFDQDLLTDAVSGLRAFASIEWFWFRAGLISEGIRLATEFLRVAPNAESMDRARAYGVVAVLSATAGDLPAAAAALDAADRQMVDSGNESSWYAGQLAYLRSVMWTVTSRLEQAEQSALHAIEIGRATGVALVQANGLMQLGVIGFRRGDVIGGEELLSSVAAVTAKRGSPWTGGMAALHLARELLASSPDSPAIGSAITAAVRVFRDERDLNTLATSILVAADLAERRGKDEFAWELRKLVGRAAHDLNLPIDALNTAMIAEHSLTIGDDSASPDAKKLLIEAAALWLQKEAQQV